MRKAYVSMICGDGSYLPGLEALGASLDASGASAPKVVMVTPEVPRHVLQTLEGQAWQIRPVERLDAPIKGDPLFPRFRNTLTKLRAWELVEYDKLVFLDADTIVLSNVDELFDRPSFAAAPDFFLPDRFNSGVMVLTPDPKVFGQMLQILSTGESYDGGDQGFLNHFFHDWYQGPPARRLPPGYNLHHFVHQFLSAHDSLRPLASEEKIVHYTLQKPWQSANVAGGSELWWRMYGLVHPETDSAWKRQLHKLEDRSFDWMVSAIGG